MNLTNADAQIRQYFYGLPISLQESILQTDIKIESLEHLQNLADNMLSKNSDSMNQ